MMANGTTCRCTQQGMVAGDVASDTTDGSAGRATGSLGTARQSCRRREGEG